MSPKMLDGVHGSAQSVASLKTALEGGALAHAVMLAAPDGCGRNFVARCLAADYLFPEGGAGAAAVMRGESSEVLLVQGEGKSGQIPVARIREVRSDVFLSSLSAAGRVVHIRDAHRMAAPAANALLKVLEEPPADVLFILTCQSPDALPATIASRCAVYTLAPLEQNDCETLLRAAAAPGTDPALPGLLAALYGGRAGLGLAALGDAGRLAAVRDAMAAAKAAAGRDEYTLMGIFARYEGRADGDRERRDALLADMGCVFSASLAGAPAPGLPAMPPAVAAMLMAPVSEARATLRGNAAPKLTFTVLAARLARAGLETQAEH